MSVSKYPNIKERSASLLINTLLAYAVFICASGRSIPTGGLETVWFFSALSLWFLALLSAPWFVPPRDAITGSAGTILTLTTIDLSGVALFRDELNWMRWAFVAFSLLVTVLGILALFLHDKDERSPLGKFAFHLASIFGRGEFLFTAPAVISIVGAYQLSFAGMGWLLVFWILLVVGKPVEKIASAWRQLHGDTSAALLSPTVGTIDRIDHPGIVRVKLSSARSWRANRLFTVSMPDGSQHYVVSLFSQIQGSEVIGTGLCVATASENINLPSGFVSASHDDQKTAEFIENLSGSKDAQLVGFVVENSNIGIVAFEVAADSNLKEGDVVFARVSTCDVFYQIVAAETVEESFDRNPRGTHVVRAAQLGSYSAKEGFSKFPWLPAMNAPLFSANSRVFEAPIVGEREFKIGKIPSSGLDAVARIDELVECHTAVLGITGTGKTELALDILREAANQGIKVFCVDFTGDYRERLVNLKPIFPAPSSEATLDLERKLFDVETGEYGAKNEKKALKEWIDKIRNHANNEIKEFLENDQTNLAIFELGEITNTKASLRLTELYLSAIMAWARAHRRARQVLIVLEEAHTIVPEVFGSGFDADTQFVVSRIGQIALQGRKYGVGLMIISQRTALVSKTILSQCNTFLTHSLIDQTSLNFLESVYSSQHTRLIPNLGKFEFLAFGKAIKAERPIILARDFDQAKLDASLALRKTLPIKSTIEIPNLEVGSKPREEPRISTL
jgi:hypothetical protein